MQRTCGILAVLLLAMPAWAAEPETGKRPLLTPKEIAEGSILLWDGETTFGWTIDGQATMPLDLLLLGGDKETTARTTTEFGDFLLQFRYAGETAARAEVILNGEIHALMPYQNFRASKNDWISAELTVTSREAKHSVRNKFRVSTVLGFSGASTSASPSSYPSLSRTTIAFHVPAGSRLGLRDIKLKPLNSKPIFNGKDLSGWKEFPGRKSKFTVNDKGELNIKDGNGDLQTEGQWDDFILQLECISNGKHLNSGVFFRCIPNEYQNGYEAQIHNGYKDEDRTKPIDFGTGAIYRRQPARKVIPNDQEWFTKTIVAHGNHLAVWVNGVQVSDFTDTRPPNNNARNGTKLEKGPISLQGHDPTTDLSFRHLRLAELPKVMKK